MLQTKRMVGRYTIIQSLKIGDKEVALCENLEEIHGLHYMCCLLSPGASLEDIQTITGDAYFELLKLFPHTVTETIAGENYLEILNIYLSRIHRQLSAVYHETQEIGKTLHTFTEEHCALDLEQKDLVGEVVVMKMSALQPEYRHGAFQLVVVTGGPGATAYPGTEELIFTHSPYTGKAQLFRRCDVLGLPHSETLPDWAVKKNL